MSSTPLMTAIAWRSLYCTMAFSSSVSVHTSISDRACTCRMHASCGSKTLPSRTGKFLLSDSVVDYGFLGVELISELGTGIQFVDPLQVYAPKRNVRVNIANPTAAFNREYLFSPGAIFAVNQQKYDSRYILTSLDFARRLFNYDTEVSSIEMKLKPGSNIGSVQKKIAGILGDRFIVQNRYEQQDDVFRIMEIEKLISYLFLTFISMAETSVS